MESVAPCAINPTSQSPVTTPVTTPERESPKEIQRNTEAIFKKFLDALEEMGESLEDPKATFNELLGIQATEKGASLQLSSSPKTMVTPDCIHLIFMQFGKGTSCEVHGTIAVDTTREAKDNKDRAIKISPIDFELENLFFKALIKASGQTKLPGIDLMRATYATNDNRYVGIFKASQGSFDKLDYENRENPVEEMTLQLHNIVCGLALMHEHNFVHCDLKDENFLFNLDPDSKGRTGGKLTDFAFVRKAGSWQDYRCSPLYIHLSVYGNTFAEQIENEKNANGRPNTTHDVFSFGRAIQFGLLDCLTQSIAKKNGQTVQGFIDQLNPAYKENLTVEELENLWNNNPHAVTFAKMKNSNLYRAVVFLPREEMLPIMHRLIAKISPNMNEKELCLLNFWTTLAYDLQNFDLSALPTMPQVKIRLETMLALGKGANKRTVDAIYSSEVPESETLKVQRHEKDKV